MTRLKIPSLIATLGTAAIANGFAFWATQGVAFVGRWPAEFTALARGNVLGIPAPVLWAARRRADRAVRAEADAARPAHDGDRRRRRGGAARRHRDRAHEADRPDAVGRLRRLGAVLLAANLSSAAPNMAGDYLLQAIAAVLLGMTMFEPGHANVPGTLVGALILALLNNGLVLIGAPYFMQDILLGVIIVASVALSASDTQDAPPSRSESGEDNR